MQKPKISIVAAIGRRRELGRGNELLWHIPDDLKRFKALTTGHPIIMGRKTFESIGKPLPGRHNIVITRGDWAHEGATVAHSLEEALEKAGEDAFVIGGSQIYEQALPFCDTLYLTLIDDEKPADAFFPEYEGMFKEIRREEREWNGLKYAWVDYLAKREK